MTAAEFDEYLSWVVADYASEMVRNGRATPDESTARAQASFDSLLPRGLETPGQVLLIAEDPDTGERVGHLWLGPASDAADQAWVYDVTVEEDLRGRGYGRAIMQAFEREAATRGYARAGLNVFGDNEVARGLYESLGYREVARQMAKDL
ncbi:MAG TPA: GNAT family N-acetyltransferase [Actinomycetota bacterium]